MSTEQTGVNAPTSEEPTPDEHAPRGSRRAIRQAERAAEREAILTGQQPLLTRREMRRLREEAKALRAAVEAGEKLGFLPGDLQSKVDPYLRPLYDGLFDMLGADNFTKYQERGSIEVAPLAYMRGRTLDDSFIILDEAQNTTPEQMKMFLTRLGFGSKAVITGDITQIDLPDGKQSGLREALRVLDGVEGIAQCFLTEKDVVRHELVQRIVKAYAEYENKKGKGKPAAKPAGKRLPTRRKEGK